MASRVRHVFSISVAIATVWIVAVQVPLIGYHTYANVDEAYAMALGARILDGHKLYEGAISQRGPLMYYLFALIAKIHGWDNPVGVRMWAIGFSWLTMFVTARFAKLEVSDRAGAMVALAIAFALTVGFPPSDGLALHGELLQAPLLVGAALLWRAGTASSLARTFLAGLLLGLAVSIKQSVLLHALPFAIWIFVSREHRARQCLAFGVGLVGPVIFFAAHAYATGTLAALVYYCVTYNREVHLNPGGGIGSIIRLGLLESERHALFVVMLSALVLRGVRFARTGVRASLRAFGSEDFVWCHAVLALVTALGMYRFFPHYFVQVLPFALLVAATELRATLERSGVVLFAASFGTFLAAARTVGLERPDGRVTYDKVQIRAAKYVEATTQPSDSIVVWGFSPALYPLSHRKPAGRYVFSTYVTGYVPWFGLPLARELARAVPGSMDAFIGDLEREKPAVVIDAGSVMILRPLLAYPKMAQWLSANYCFEVRIGGFDVYRRRAEGRASCAVEYFPEPHSPIDWMGSSMDDTLPELGTTGPRRRALDATDGANAHWFREAPPAMLDKLRD